MPENSLLQPAIEFVGVGKEYAAEKPVVALQNVHLQIKQAEVFGVVGESGAGKSTFLELCLGLQNATSGRVSVLGVDLAALNPKNLRELRRKIGTVFQGNNLLNNLNVAKNVAMPLGLMGRKDPNRVVELLEFVGLSDRANNYPAELSGGQRQRVAIARALMTRPQIILFDEPTSALDNSTRGEMLQLIHNTNKEFATTCVLVSHDLGAVKRVCDRAALLTRGQLQEVVTVQKCGEQDERNYLDHAREYLSE